MSRSNEKLLSCGSWVLVGYFFGSPVPKQHNISTVMVITRRRLPTNRIFQGSLVVGKGGYPPLAWSVGTGTLHYYYLFADQREGEGDARRSGNKNFLEPARNTVLYILI